MIHQLPQEVFRLVVQNTNLFALDLIIENSEGRVLLGMRNNPPAQRYWFVPGGRVHKNESLKNAFVRILYEEAGYHIEDAEKITLQGIYDHIYEDNIFGDPGFNTHYVVGACRVTLNGEVPHSVDSQHKLLHFFSVAELLADPLVHQFVKFYFLANPPNIFMLCTDKRSKNGRK